VGGGQPGAFIQPGAFLAAEDWTSGVIKKCTVRGSERHLHIAPSYRSAIEGSTGGQREEKMIMKLNVSKMQTQVNMKNKLGEKYNHNKKNTTSFGKCRSDGCWARPPGFSTLRISATISDTSGLRSPSRERFWDKPSFDSEVDQDICGQTGAELTNSNDGNLRRLFCTLRKNIPNFF